MLTADFLKIVRTRQLEDGRWQFGLQREGRPTMWACGEYKTEKGAVQAAIRRHFR